MVNSCTFVLSIHYSLFTIHNFTNHNSLIVGALDGVGGLVDDAVADEAVAGEEFGEGGRVGVAGEIGLAVTGEDLQGLVVQLCTGAFFPLFDAGSSE